VKIIDFNKWRKQKRRKTARFNTFVSNEVLKITGIIIIIGYLLSFLRLPIWLSTLLALSIVAYGQIPYYKQGRRYR
jgi:hypothetical protein